VAAGEAPAKIRWVGCDISKASFIDAAAAAFQKKTGHLIESSGASFHGAGRRACPNEDVDRGPKVS
jgi:hypothetical protein